MIQETFHLFAIPNTDYIKTDVVKLALASLRILPNKKDLKMILSRSDKGKSGKLNQSEFSKIAAELMVILLKLI
jgi:Ca2+-binding EF-hand superfamily protein